MMFTWLLVVLVWGIRVVTTNYPVSASWFDTSTSRAQLITKLNEFSSIGGDTIYVKGGNFQTTYVDFIRNDPVYTLCKEDDGLHCVDYVHLQLYKLEVTVDHWIIYEPQENFTDSYLRCREIDGQRVTANWTFRWIVLSLNDSRSYSDCMLRPGDHVAVVFSSFTGAVDARHLLVQEAGLRNMSVYFGLPKVPYIGTDMSSMALKLSYMRFVERLANDSFIKYFKAVLLKGYYSDIELTLADIYNGTPGFRRGNNSLPAKEVAPFWIQLHNILSTYQYDLVKSPGLDLTYSSLTTLQQHALAFQTLRSQAGHEFVLRDGRGDGRAAYYSNQEASQPIHRVDNSLYEMLRQKNSSVNEKTTYNDVYYASIADEYNVDHLNCVANMGMFFDELDKLNAKNLSVMLEAYQVLNSTSSPSYCGEIQPGSSGMSLSVSAVNKTNLDRAVAEVGAKVRFLTAFSWDPLFTCRTKASIPPLFEQVAEELAQPVISECRFHSPQNISIVLLGYNLDGLQQSFHVDYQIENGPEDESADIYGYYYELDYGKQNALNTNLQYVMLFDLPYIRDLKKNGSITVQARGASRACTFTYTL